MRFVIVVVCVCAAGKAFAQWCSQPETVYSGELEAFALYDQWLDGPSTVNPTSTCGNQDLFFPLKNDKFVAIGYVPMSDGLACGACVNLTSSNGISEILTVMEGINKANDGDVQLAQSTATRLKGPGVSWKFVACPITGTIQYRFPVGATMSNSATIGFSNFALGIRSVAVQSRGAWTELQRNSASVNWNLPSGSLSLPLKVQLTSAKYETVTFSVPAITGDGSLHDTGVAFTGACREPPTTSPLSATKKSSRSGSSSKSNMATLFLAFVVPIALFYYST